MWRFIPLTAETGPSPGAAASDSVGPSVFDALEDQLGLNLQSAKGSVEFLVIDHVGRPSAN
jgi:uncharacterized protein (TIGR03435 family)